MTISFTVPAVPVAQPRAKATAINGRARMYEAGKSHAIHTFKALVKLVASETTRPLEGPLSVELTFVFPRPAAMRWKAKPMPRVPKASKPDCDNLIKSVLDALNGLCFLDDSQVASVTAVKCIASADEQPHVSVTISEM